MTNIEIAKKIIKENLWPHNNCGLYFCVGLGGDTVTSLYNSNELSIYVCESWGYFEVFGLNHDEQKELEEFYDNLVKSM